MAFASKNLSKNELLKKWINANYKVFLESPFKLWVITADQFKPNRKDWYSQFKPCKTKAEVNALLSENKFHTIVEKNEGELVFLMRSANFCLEFLSDEKTEKLYRIAIDVSKFPSRDLQEFFDSYKELKSFLKGQK